MAYGGPVGSPLGCRAPPVAMLHLSALRDSFQRTSGFPHERSNPGHGTNCKEISYAGSWLATLLLLLQYFSQALRTARALRDYVLRLARILAQLDKSRNTRHALRLELPQDTVLHRVSALALSLELSKVQLQILILGPDCSSNRGATYLRRTSVSCEILSPTGKYYLGRRVVNSCQVILK